MCCHDPMRKFYWFVKRCPGSALRLPARLLVPHLWQLWQRLRCAFSNSSPNSHHSIGRYHPITLADVC